MANLPTLGQPMGRVVGEQVFWDPTWYRYIWSSGPDGTGGTTGVLHGNPLGPPTWGPVVLTTDVSGVLPFANGGTGLSSGTSGGIPYFNTSTSLASSGALTQFGLVTGGGVGSSPASLALGTTTQVLHGNASGLPTWGSVSLTADVSGTLPITHGGTGTTTATGTGNLVLATSPTITNAILSAPLIGGAQIDGQIAWDITAVPGAHLISPDNNTHSVTAAATTLVNVDKASLFIVHDQTSGGMTLGLMDATGGIVIVSAGVLNIAFTRLAGTGLQAAVTGGANPRSLSTFSIALGAP